MSDSGGSGGAGGFQLAHLILAQLLATRAPTMLVRLAPSPSTAVPSGSQGVSAVGTCPAAHRRYGVPRLTSTRSPTTSVTASDREGGTLVSEETELMLVWRLSSLLQTPSLLHLPSEHKRSPTQTSCTTRLLRNGVEKSALSSALT